MQRFTSADWDKTQKLSQFEKSMYVFACVNKIAEKVAETKFKLCQIKNSRGDIKEIINHPALDLLYNANPFQTRGEFLRITMINLKLAGDAFWLKIRNNSGQVVELWNLRPDCVEIIKDPAIFVKGYKFSKADGTTVTFAPEDIVHLKKPTPLDDYYGASPISSAKTRIETEQYANTYQRDFFLNNARPDAILKFEGQMSPEDKQEIRERFEARHRGEGKNSRVALFEGGLEYQQISVSQREMDYIESLKFTRDDILVAFQVPKPIVAVTDDVNRANSESAIHTFLSETIKPEVTALCEYLNEQLIAPDFDPRLFIDFEDPTPENREATITEYEKGLKPDGWLLINEVRAKENLEPIPGGWDKYVPLNYVPLSSAGQAAAAAQAQAEKFALAWVEKKKAEQEAAALRIFRGKGLLRAQMELEEMIAAKVKEALNAGPCKKPRRKDEAAQEQTKVAVGIIADDLKATYADVVNKGIDQRSQRFGDQVNKHAANQEKEVKALARTLKLNKTLKNKMPDEAREAINAYYNGQAPIWAEFSFPYIEEFTREAGVMAMAMVNPDKGFEMTEKIRETLKKRAEEFGLGVSTTTRDKITETIREGIEAGEGANEIADRIGKVYDEFPTWRTDLISRTEATAANNEGFVEAYKQSEIATHKEWIAVMDARTRPEHAKMNGEIVPVGKNFSNKLPYPMEPNCRCVIGPAFEK